MEAISLAVVVGLLVSLAIGAHIGGSGRADLRSHPGCCSAPGFPIASVTSLDASVFKEVGLPSVIVNYPKGPTGTHRPLALHGLPELLYIWASYCSSCAAENWALIMALSRFGTFSYLNTAESSGTGFAPDTQTLSFYQAKYSSIYLVFESYDLAKNVPAQLFAKCKLGGFACLQKAPPADMALMRTIGQSSLPFMDFGNKLVQSGAGYDNQPLTLHGLTARQIAAQLSNPDSSVARVEVGSANYFTAAICAMTGNQPRAICSTSLVTQAEMNEGILTDALPLFVLRR